MNFYFKDLCMLLFYNLYIFVCSIVPVMSTMMQNNNAYIL